MADTSGTERPRDPKKVFIGGLNDTVTADLLRQVVEPAAKGDQIVSVEVKPETVPEFAGKKMAFFTCKDEGTAGAVKDFFNGMTNPDLVTEGKVEAELAFVPKPPDERAPQQRLTKAEMEGLAELLLANPRFVERCASKLGRAPTKDEVVAGLRPHLVTDLKTALAPVVKVELQNDLIFRGLVKGAPGKDGMAPTKDEVVAGLKADPTVKGADGKNAPQWPSWVLIALAILALIIAGYAACGSNGGEQGPQGIQGQIGPQGPRGPEGPVGPQGEPAIVEETPAEPTAVVPAPEPEPAPAAEAPTTPHAVGAVVIHNRFDKVEVRLDEVEQ